MKLFKINTLEGKTFTFNFNCKDNLKTFRTNLTMQYPYTIIYKGQSFIYANDNDDMSIEELMMLTNSLMIELDMVQCYLTLNFGFPRLRQGKLLLKPEEIIENVDLICPITLEAIQYAIKLNGKFYDLNAIAEYLANAFNKNILTCPMRINIPDELISCIYKHHYPSTKFTKSSMQACLYAVNSHQEEYNKLIKMIQ